MLSNRLLWALVLVLAQTVIRLTIALGIVLLSSIMFGIVFPIVLGNTPWEAEQAVQFGLGVGFGYLIFSDWPFGGRRA